TVRELTRELSRDAGDDPKMWRFACEHAYTIATSSADTTTEAWLALVDVEYENLRAVLARLLHVAPADAMELAGRLAYYWYLRGDYLEGTQWLEQAIERSSGREGEALARALLGAGRLALLTCRYARAEELVERA